jgi:hypothetical protein
MKASWTFMLAWLLAVAAVAKADAQTGPYPNKPVQIITDSSAGSTPDVALRFVADGLTQGSADKPRRRNGQTGCQHRATRPSKRVVHIASTQR